MPKSAEENLQCDRKLNKKAMTMPIDHLEITEIAELYLDHKLNDQQLKTLEHKRASSEFDKSFLQAVSLVQLMRQKAAKERFAQNLKSIAQQQKAQDKTESKKISLYTHYWRTAAVAAGVAVVTSLSTHLLKDAKSNEAKKYSELKKVRTEIEGIKQSQSKIIKDLDNKANKPPIENKYSGTGFALSNNGYLVTNYHVTEGADSIYIETNKGQYHKASLVSFDAKSDIAILKVESKKFKFSKQEQLPYNFALGKIKLGEKVFTLGYPETEVVYKEGYISSQNGYLGDSIQYRLELPAEPGQSGSPILNNQGSIIGMLSGKATNSSGTTYAVSSDAMLRMLHNIPQNSTINLPKSSRLVRLNRAEQIERIQDFTCVVHIYKK